MEKVVHADTRIWNKAKGYERPLTIGSANNDLKNAYRNSIELAKKNGNQKLVDVLTECLTLVCQVDDKALDAICLLQD